MVSIKTRKTHIVIGFNGKYKMINILFSLFAFHSCIAQPTNSNLYNKKNNSLLWEISGKGLEKPSYLFGTFHMMCRDDISFSKNLVSSLQQADAIYLEMDLGDPENTIGALKLMKMNDGETIKNLLSESDYNRLKNFFFDKQKGFCLYGFNLH